MLVVEGLRRRYGDVVALDGCSFTARPGRLLGFLGPNGAGKTTTMRAIFGLVRLDDGTITWQGTPIDDEIRRRFGYMPEERGLYPRMPAAEQVAYLGTLHGLDGAEAIDRARALLTELGLGERLDDRVEQLSHGNQQRVQLAASLVHDPELLVLDEPFAGLDPIGVDSMSGVLRRRAAEGAGVVFSSHQLDLVEDLCEDVAIVHRGRVVLAGELSELRAASPERRVEADLEGRVPDDLDEVVPGARLLERRDGRVILLVARDVTPEAVLEGLRRYGRVTRFTYEPPRLEDLFRQAVGVSVAAAEAEVRS